MNLDRFHGVVMQFSGTLKEQWGRLARNPRALAAGKSDRFAGRILERRGIAVQDAERQLEEFMRRNRNWWNVTGR